MHDHKWFFWGIALIAAALLAACSSAVAPTAPATPPLPTPALTVCAAGCDFTTLRAALDARTTLTGAIIGLVDAVHTESGIVINKSVILQGQGVSNTILQAAETLEAATDRVLSVAPGVSVTLRALTVRHGNPREMPTSGGGIRNEGTLTLETVVVTHNSGSAGGGLHNDGVMTLRNSWVAHNEARGGGDSYQECKTGGGIKNMRGQVTLINSAITDNISLGKGGGVHVACNGLLVLINSTISGNRAQETGGGIHIDGRAELLHATISDNTAHTGGGVFAEGSGERGVIRGQLSYTHTLMANNHALLEKYGIADCLIGDHGVIAVNQRNGVADGSCAPALSGDFRLAPLANVGETAPVHALLSGSPAIGAVSAASCLLTTDQRNLPRTADCDLGAFETQP